MNRAFRICLFLLFLTGLLIPGTGRCQSVRYKHPQYDFSFVATPGWDQEYGDFNGKEFRVIHPNHSIRISLSYVPGCRNPDSYMRRISGIKGLVCKSGQFDTVLHDFDAVVMRGQCLEGREPFISMVVGFPRESGLYLMEICCPEDCDEVHRQKVRAILSSVRIGA